MPAICREMPRKVIILIESTEIPHVTNPQKYEDKSQIRKIRNVLSSSVISSSQKPYKESRRRKV